MNPELSILQHAPDRSTRRKVLRFPRRLGVSLAAASAFLAASAVAAPPASAVTYGWVYISTPTWLANCNWGNNGRVTGLHLSVGGTWTTPAGGDWGDDLVYARVRLYEYQQVSYSAYCNKWPGSWQSGVAQTIRPTRNNQTVWVGPAGVRYN